MVTLNFGGVVEEVTTGEEFPLEKARQVLKDETVAVLGYGVQGPAQALNLRDNGIRVIVGQKSGSKSWEKALNDGWVPGETLFPLEEAAERGTVVQYLVSDAAQKLTWPQIKPNLRVGDALYFSHGFAVVYKDQTGVSAPEYVDVDEDWSKLTYASGKSQDAPLFIDPNPMMTASQMHQRAKKIKRQHGLSLVVIDYLQLMTEGGDTRNNELSTITRKLKMMAKDLNVPVICLSQLSESRGKGG